VVVVAEVIQESAAAVALAVVDKLLFILGKVYYLHNIKKQS
jgi:hypothetical protein